MPKNGKSKKRRDKKMNFPITPCQFLITPLREKMREKQKKLDPRSDFVNLWELFFISCNFRFISFKPLYFLGFSVFLLLFQKGKKKRKRRNKKEKLLLSLMLLSGRKEKKAEGKKKENGKGKKEERRTERK